MFDIFLIIYFAFLLLGFIVGPFYVGFTKKYAGDELIIFLIGMPFWPLLLSVGLIIGLPYWLGTKLSKQK